MSISSNYNHQEIEKKWYSHWMKNDYFSSTPDDRDPYSIVIPPPNITGVLHMGHMLNNTIQDILIRRARLLGKMHVGSLARIMHQLQLKLKLLKN